MFKWLKQKIDAYLLKLMQPTLLRIQQSHEEAAVSLSTRHTNLENKILEELARLDQVKGQTDLRIAGFENRLSTYNSQLVAVPFRLPKI